MFFGALRNVFQIFRNLNSKPLYLFKKTWGQDISRKIGGNFYPPLLLWEYLNKSFSLCFPSEGKTVCYQLTHWLCGDSTCTSKREKLRDDYCLSAHDGTSMCIKCVHYVLWLIDSSFQSFFKTVFLVSLLYQTRMRDAIGAQPKPPKILNKLDS